MPGTVIYYTSYDQLKLAMGYKENYLGKDNVNWAPAVAGSLARSEYTVLCLITICRRLLM